MSPRRTRSGRGAATAELAMVLPMLLGVTVALVWLLSLGLDQMRLVDAAQEAARQVARGASESDALAQAQRVGPAGTALSIERGDRITVTASTAMSPPGMRWFPAAHLHAKSVAVPE